MLSPITSRNHEVVKRFRKLSRRTYRDRFDLFMVEGLNLISEGLDSGAKLRELAYVESRAEEAAYIRTRLDEPVPMHEVSQPLMDWISDVVTSQGIVGIMEQVSVDYDELINGEVSMLLVADQVRDPGNMGALLRIGDAAGVDGFVMTAGSVDLYNPKVVRSAAGSHFHVAAARDVEMSRLSKDLEGRVAMLGLDPRGDRSYLDEDFSRPVALVVGNEAFGISDDDRFYLDGTVYIDMPGKAESLNVASAAAVVLFEALRQRRSGCGG
ncbi:MAG TPA: RNA methyltransferase [Candidatus Anoxymicrobiaceae bacterium]